MAGYSLGTAWIQISPSMKGMRTSIERELGGVSTRPAERSIVSGLGGAFKQVGAIATAALGAAAAIGVGMGFADVASQALSAADATLKFKNTLSFAGIASDQIEALTASTKEYADKTVYGLDDIQNITAQLASNGVEGYDKLAEAAGNLNAVAGGNAETFKSVGMVLTQTAGQGKLTTENWNQLSDAIPGASGKIQQALLDAGAYTGNFRDAMAKGEISAEEFNAAIMDLGMTDVAKEAATSTQTMEGAWGNFEATMVTGAQQIAEKALPYITGALSKMSEWATKAFDWVNNSLIPSLSSLWSILAKGDFTGPIFGLEEDSGFVDFLFNVRDAAMAAGQWISSTLVPSIQSVYNILANGDFTGPIFGLEEDSGLVAFLIDMREAAISLWETLTGSVIPGVTGFLSDVANSSAFSTVTSFFGALATNEGVLLAVVGAFTAWKTVMAGISLASFIASIVTGTGALITNTGAWITNTAAMIASKAQTVVLMGMYAGEFVADLVKTGVQLGIQAGAWIATTAAQAAHTVVGWANIAMQGAAKVATVGWTAAQWLLNAALNANPIGLIVIAIAALVAGLIYAWNNSETFRSVVTAAWEGIKTAVGVVVDWLSTNVWPIIQSVWGYISAGAQGLWSVITTVWNAIWGAISAVVSWLVSTAWPLIQGVWTWIQFGAQLLWFGIQFYWAAIRLVISAVVDWLVNTAWPFIQNVWNWISTGASTLWSYIQSAWNGIKSAISVVVDWLTGTVWPAIQSVWNWISTGANTLWTMIQTAWNGIKSAIGAVGDWLYNTLWTRISSVWDGIKSGAEKLHTAIGNAFDKIKEKTARPINFVIGTVYTNGIKKLVDGVMEKVGLDLRMPDVPQVGGYASGGVLPGYSPGKDIYHFISNDGGGRLALSGGEAIMRPEWVRAIGGPRMVDAMNRAAAGHRRVPGGDAGYGYRGFAPGGVWDGAQKALAGAGRSVAGAASWMKETAEAAADIITDPVGAIENLVWTPVKAMLDAHSDTGVFWEAGKAIPKKLIDGIKDWFKEKAKSADVGVASDLVGQARLAIGTPYVWGGVSVPGGVDCSGLVYWAANKLGKGWPRLTAAGYQAGSRPGNPNVPGTLLFWGNPAHHVAIASGGGRMIEAPTFGVPVREIAIYGGPSAGVYGYDDGGWLPPGGTMAVNATGRPEAVMTRGQWDKIDRLVGALENGLFAQRDLIVRDADGELVGRMRTEAEGAIIDYDRMRG